MDQTPPAELIEFLTPYSSTVTELFLAARDMIFAVSPDATEFVNDAPYTISTAYTYTHSYVLGFAHIAAATKHVNIGFDYGVNLSDPQGRLLGEGKRVRHISIRSIEDLDDPYVKSLVVQAEELAHRPEDPREPQTVIMRMKGSKRRP